MLNKNFKEHIYAVTILFILLSVAFYDIFFLDKTLKVTTANSQALPNGVYGQANNRPKFIPVNGTDSPVLEEPIYEFIKKNLHKGILPLWNPHQACGYPLIGMLEVGIFFPLNIILYSFPEIYSWDILILLRIFLAGIFIYWLMRYLGFQYIPSLATGIIFMFSGPMVLLQYWTVNVDILAPLLLLAIEHLLKKPKSQSMVYLGLIIALTIFAGHPEHIFLVNFLGVCFFIFRLFNLRKETDLKKSILYFFFAYILATGLAAITLLPFFRNFISEFWHGHPPKVGLMMEENPSRALSLALPHFFQKVNLTFQWEFAGWWGGYLGTIPIGLAFISLFNKTRKGLQYFFFLFAFLTLSKAYALPYINWIGYLPIFSLLRYAIHTPPLVAFTVAIAAGIGLDTILSQKNIYPKGLFYGILLIIIIMIHLIVLRESPAISIAYQATLFAIVVLTIFQIILYLHDRQYLKTQITSILILCIIFLELFLYIHREHPFRFSSFDKVPYIERLQSSKNKIRSYGNFWAFYPNTATGYEVDDLGYFVSLVPKRFVQFINSIVLNNYFKANLNPPALRAIPIQNKEDILDLLNVKYIIRPSSDEYQQRFSHFEDITKNLSLVYSKEVKVYERPNTYPRAFIVHRVIFEPRENISLRLIHEIGPQLRQVAVINHPALFSLTTKLENVPAVDKSLSLIKKYSPNEVLIEVFAEHAGFLVLSDAYHPDWKAYIDGKKTTIFQTDYLLRSVFIEEGHHEIRFVFLPFSFFLGAFLTITSIIIVILLLALPWMRRNLSKSFAVSEHLGPFS